MQNIQQYLPQNAKVELHGNIALFKVEAEEIISLANNLSHEKKLVLKLITATDERTDNSCFKIWYVFGAPQDNVFIVPYLELTKTEDFPSLAPTIHGAWNYEKKIKTFFGLNPVGHPDTRPLLLHENWPADVFPLRKDFAWNTRPALAHGTYNFQKVKGEGIYEIPVGPIHAGIIEPGHFRFSVAGEEIVQLEPRLGFTHKGSEKLFEELALADKIRLSEKISGDSSFSHSLAFCQALEQLGDITVSTRARYLRVIYAELERLANHFGDIGAMMLDTGFNFGGSQGARLREMILQINEKLTASRFLRGVNCLGGVTKDLAEAKQRKYLADFLATIMTDFSEIIAIAENSVSLLNRLKGTGILSQQQAVNCGIMGVAGKAVGIERDTRLDYPYAGYGDLILNEIATEQSGDAYARFYVRIKEVYTSIQLILQALIKMPQEAMVLPAQINFKPDAVAVSCVEGWRGEIVYFVATDKDGNISRVAPRDPSFVNWSALEYAGFSNVVPDFPLINKSFNMSYTGNDL
jgi:Ni,Fe-hydrogenase III large subunit/Ni,Fe-hydrogenase III component G